MMATKRVILNFSFARTSPLCCKKKVDFIDLRLLVTSTCLNSQCTISVAAHEAQ